MKESINAAVVKYDNLNSLLPLRTNNKCKHCNITASFNYLGFHKKEYCASHRLDNMCAVYADSYSCKKCYGIPSYAMPKTLFAEYCEVHRTAGMILKNKGVKCLCCNNIATYNFRRTNYVIFCEEHKLPKMVLKKMRICAAPNCTHRGTYLTEDKILYCGIHRPISLQLKRTAPKCIQCDKYPLYNYADKKGKRYCPEHKLPGMIKKIKMCLLCEKRPTYNYPEEKKPAYCTSHKAPNMVLKSGTCIKCDRTASCNYKDVRGVKYCTVHKAPGMVYKNKSMCRAVNCGRRARYNYPGGIGTVYCRDHSLPGMISKYRKICKKCTMHASYCYPWGGNYEYCRAHSLPGMISGYMKEQMIK